MGGVRSLLARWIGGAGADAPGSVRSLLAFWIGGAVPPAAPTEPTEQAGVRSLLAFWAGGAVQGAAPVLDETPVSAGDYWKGYQAKPKPDEITGRLVLRVRLDFSGTASVLHSAVHGSFKLSIPLRIEALGTVDNALPEQLDDEDELIILAAFEDVF